MHLRPIHSLTRTTLPWIRMRDHFVSTVGEQSGRGVTLGPLVVLAEAIMAAGARFPLHSHREMEILTVVLEGELSHHGDQAHGQVIKAGHVQLISARDGMQHAEGNDSPDPTRILQIWFAPDVAGGEAQYFGRRIGDGEREPVAGDDVLPLRCDVRVYRLNLSSSETTLPLEAGRTGYLVAASGALSLQDGSLLEQGEAVIAEASLSVRARSPVAAALWIDLRV